MKKKITALLAGIFALVITANGQLAPTVTFTATPSTICACSSVVFTNTSTNAPTTWSWYFPGATNTTYTTVTTFPGNPGPITYCTPGTYPVSCVVRNGSGSDSVTVTNCIKVVPLPTVTINPPYAGICDTAGGSAFDTVYFTTTGNAGNIYKWAPGASLSCTNCPNPKATPTITTVYTVTVTGTSGCIATYYDTVTVGYITCHITGKDSICMGSIDTLTASGGSQNPPGTTYVWSNFKTTSSISVSPTVPTTYSCTITSGSGGCTSSAFFRVYPYPVPVYALSFNPADSICAGQSVTITASPGGGIYQYYWYGPFGGQDTINYWNVDPTTSTTYTLVARNKGCYFDSLIHIKVNNPPVVRFSGATNLCQGSTTTICATGGTQYHWSTGQSTSCVNVKPWADITYTVQVRNGACFKDTTFTIMVDTMPNVKFKGDTSICTGDSTTIYASGGYTYLWTTGSTADSIANGYPLGGLYTYYVTVTKGACSKDSSKIVVKVYPHPKPKIYPLDTTVCEYDSVTLTATGGDYYIWSPKPSSLNHYKGYGDTDRNKAAPPITTTYDVKVCTWGCCRDTNHAVIHIIPGPNGKVCCDTTVGSGTPVQLTTTLGSGPYIVQGWYPTYGLSCSNCADPVATVNVTTTYVVTLQDLLTLCTAKDSVTIDIFNCNIFVPTAFSPNGDGNNDYLYVRSLCLKALDFAIFDRWGNKVFETRNQNTPWDGTYNGKPMNMGTYMWYLNGLYEDGTNITKSGNVTLVR